MSDVILAVVERAEAASKLLNVATGLARLTKAKRVIVLAVRTPPIATITPTEQVLSGKDEIRIRAQEQARTAALKHVYDGWASTEQMSDLNTEWSDVEGRGDEVVGHWGRRCDHIVLGRPGRRDLGGELAVRGAVFGTDRPVLLIPPEPTSTSIGRRVAIAWRDDTRTTKAVLAALRWLKPAEQVFVLAGARDDRVRPRPPDILVEHGMQADLHVLPVTHHRAFGEALLARAHALGADLLVLGAQLRPRTFGYALGGVTRHMLNHADLPILLRH